MLTIVKGMLTCVHCVCNAHILRAFCVHFSLAHCITVLMRLIQLIQTWHPSFSMSCFGTSGHRGVFGKTYVLFFRAAESRLISQPPLHFHHTPHHSSLSSPLTQNLPLSTPAKFPTPFNNIYSKPKNKTLASI